MRTGAKFAESAPWLTLGLLITVTLQQVKLPTVSMKRLLSFSEKRPSFSQLVWLCLKASLLGLATPLCSCGAIPMAIGLSSSGASPAAVVSFLTAAQSAGFDSIAITYGMLGGETATVRLVGAICLSLGAGVAVGRVAGSSTETCDDQKTKENAKDEVGKTVSKGPVAYSISLGKSVYKIFDEIWFVLLIGIFISILVEEHYGASDMTINDPIANEEYVPQPEWWDEIEDGPYPDPPARPLYMIFLSKDVLSRVIISVGSIPFQLCEHGVVSIAAGLRKSGASYGTAHAFLLAAPATNIATLGAVLKATGGKDRTAPLRSAMTISFLSFCMSYILDAFADYTSAKDFGDPIVTFALPAWWSTLSMWMCYFFIAQSIFWRFFCSLEALSGKAKVD